MTRLPLDVAAALRVASWAVPAALREEWREEWTAELWHARQDGARGMEVRRAVSGALRDARSVRRLQAAPAARRGERAMGAGAMLNEMRLALRGFLKSPGFTFLAVATLALGIGANAALFTVVDSVLLRPLGYPDAHELVTVQHPVSGNATGTWNLSLHGYFAFQDENVVFDDIGVYVPGSVNLASEAGPDRGASARVSASLLSVLGARTTAGRLLLPADNEPGAPAVAVLSHEFWQRRYGGSPDIVGSMIRVDGRETEVVGVTEPGLQLPRRSVDVWLPATLDRGSRPQNSHFYSALARLRDGVTPEAARENLGALTRTFPERLPTAYSDAFLQAYNFTTDVVPLRDDVVRGASTTLWIVFGGVSIVLLIACANVANLFLVRAEGRAREVSVRSALGASRGHLTRQFLTESVLLAVMAGVLGLFLAWGGVRALLTLAPAQLPRMSEVALRGSTVVFTAGIALLAGLVFGAFPLMHLSERRRADVLRDGGVRTTANAARHRLRGALVVAQVALALVLLSAAGLMVRSLGQLRAVEPGYDPAGALAFDVSLPFVNYREAEQSTRFWEDLLTEIRALPGVERAGITTTVPLAGGAPCSLFHVRDNPAAPGVSPPCIEYLYVSPELLETMGIDVVEGRTFTAADANRPDGVAIVSRALARQAFGEGAQAVGQGVLLYDDEPPFWEVIGVAEDVRLRDLQDAATPLVYLSFIPLSRTTTNWTVRSATVVVRTTRDDPASLTPDLRAAVAAIDPDIPIANVQTLDAVVEASLSRVSFVMLLLGIAAAVALLLGTVGLYSMVAFVVNERQTEIGIRMALGARVGEIARMVIGHALRLAGLGIGIGLLAAVASGRLLQSQLFGVSGSDPATLVGVGALLVAVAALAAWVPARRATRVNPVDTIRSA